MNKDRKYPLELLQGKSKDELIEIVENLQEEISLLDFLIAEYEGAQSSLGEALKDQLTEHINNTVLSNIETGEA